MDPHALLRSIHRPTHFVWVIRAGYPFISSHSLPTLLELEPLCLTNSLRMPCDLDHFITPCSSELRDTLQGHDRTSFEAVIERVWDTLGGCHGASSEMQLEAMIGRTWRAYSCEVRDTLGGCDRASLEMHLEAAIQRVWRCTWMGWLCEHGERIRARFEINPDAVLS